MSDFISRQALCDDLREYKVHPVPISSDESEVKGYNDGIDLAISVIADFPSENSERNKGEWIRKQPIAVGEPRFICSECRGQFRNPYNFCPNCGADMRGTL